MADSSLVLGRCAGREPNGRLCRRATDPAWIFCEHHQHQILQAGHPAGTPAADNLADEIDYLRLSVNSMAASGYEHRLRHTLVTLSRVLASQRRLGGEVGGLEALLAAVAADITRMEESS